jgi:phosphonate transport system permease protein
MKRDWWLRTSLALLLALMVYSWTCGEIELGVLFTEQRQANLQRFAGEEIVPYPLRETGFSCSGWSTWAGDLWQSRGAQACLATFAIAWVAISLAGIAGLLMSFLTARNAMRARPFESQGAQGVGFFVLSAAARALLVFLRAVPEYIWAFLLLAMLGPSAWPAILALAIHNAGILGKLGAESVEALDTRTLAAVRELGASRGQVSVLAALPLVLGRFLMYFFYRFETCVREATVLGMLGVVSLGYWIQDARSKQFYDEMIFFVALGALIVLAADLLSAWARGTLRRMR